MESLAGFVESTDQIFQWLAIMLIAAIPFVESYFAGPLGILAGVNPVVAICAAIIGNIISMVLCVLFGDKVSKLRHKEDKPLSPSKQKLKEKFDKYGVAVVSLVGQTVLPSQITSAAMVAFGARRNQVIFWQVISIILWGIGFGLLALAGLDLIK